MATAMATLPPPRWRLPPLETGGELLARLAHLAEPREKLTVSQWVEREQAFDLDALPWQTEVMDALSDPETSEVGKQGPAQAGKSTIGLSWLGWIIDQDPGDFLLCQPDRSMTHTFVVTRVEPFVEKIAELRRKLLATNNIFLKQFQGMFLAGIWPVPAQFAQRPARYGWIDDYDQIEEDIGATADEAGQGSAVTLLSGRQTTFEGRDTKFVSSSPADDRGGKIEAFVASGSDERLHPECPSCGDRWEIDTLRDLRWEGKGVGLHDGAGTADQAEASVHVVCPNGCVLGASDKRALLNSLARLPARGFVAANPEAGKRRRTFRVDGLLAFTGWGALARQWREAQIAWAARQDEGPMRTFVNTKAGKNHRPILSGEKPLSAVELGKRREPGFAIGTVPAGVKVIVVVVDAQATSFECAAIGFGDKLESWLIDRWAMQVYADGTPIRPFSDERDRVAEALLPLWSMTWPLADGSGRSPPALSVGIDTGGGGQRHEDSWTATAKALWHKARGWGIARVRLTLLKGGNRPNAPKLMPPAEFADRKMRGGIKRASPDLWMPNVHRIKNIIDARLRLDRPGPNYIHLPGADRPGSRKRLKSEGPAGIEDHHLEEITAEELKDGRWHKVRPRNETWDHLVYAYASILKPPFAQSRDHMRWVPAAFRVPDQVGTAAVIVAGPIKAEAAVTIETQPSPTEARPKRQGRPAWIKPAKANWITKGRR